MMIGDLCVSLEIKGGDESSHGATAQHSECLPREPDEACEPRPPPGFVMQLRSCSHRLSRCTDGVGPALVVARPPGGGTGGTRGLLVVFVGRVDVLVAGPVAEGDMLVPSGRNDGFAVSAARTPDMPAPTADSLLTIGWALGSCGPGPHVVKCDVRWDQRIVREDDAPRGEDLDVFVTTLAAACAMCDTPRRAACAQRADLAVNTGGPVVGVPAVPPFVRPSSRAETRPRSCKLTLRVQDEGWREPHATTRSIASRDPSMHAMHPATEESAAPTTPDCTLALRAAIFNAHNGSRRTHDDTRTGCAVQNNNGEHCGHESPTSAEGAEPTELLCEFLIAHTAVV